MAEKDWLSLLSGENQVQEVVRLNQVTERFGLSLTEEEARQLTVQRRDTLREQKRVEFGEGILPKLIYTFCDSPYIDQNSYVDMLARLQEIFYLYKNEMEDEITDAELLHFMKEPFETVCYGDLDYLETTCLEVFSQAVRAGYTEYRKTDGKHIYARLDEVKRWDRELYMEVLKELCWR